MIAHDRPPGSCEWCLLTTTVATHQVLARETRQRAGARYAHSDLKSFAGDWLTRDVTSRIAGWLDRRTLTSNVDRAIRKRKLEIDRRLPSTQTWRRKTKLQLRFKHDRLVVKWNYTPVKIPKLQVAKNVHHISKSAQHRRNMSSLRSSSSFRARSCELKSPKITINAHKSRQ